MLSRVVSQIVLAREDDVLAVLAHVVAVAVRVVCVLAVGLVAAEGGLGVDVVVVAQHAADSALGRVAPVAVLLRVVPDQADRTLGLEVNARQTVVVDVAKIGVSVQAVVALHAEERCVRAQRDQRTTRALDVARPVASFALVVPE